MRLSRRRNPRGLLSSLTGGRPSSLSRDVPSSPRKWRRATNRSREAGRRAAFPGRAAQAASPPLAPADRGAFLRPGAVLQHHGSLRGAGGRAALPRGRTGGGRDPRRLRGGRRGRRRALGRRDGRRGSEAEARAVPHGARGFGGAVATAGAPGEGSVPRVPRRGARMRPRLWPPPPFRPDRFLKVFPARLKMATD